MLVSFLYSYFLLDMHIFDHKTIQDWKVRNISEVSVSLIDKGCAGQKILVTEERNPNFSEK